MNENLTHLLLLSGLFLILFTTAELLFRTFKVNAEYTRKLVHVGTGLLTMLFPFMFTHYIWVIGICLLFFIILLISIKFNYLPSIHAIQRKSYGSLAYPVVVILSFMFYHLKTSTQEFFYFYIPVLVMALADPMAAFIGKLWPWGKYCIGKEQKTLSGSFAFFTISFIVNYLLLPPTQFWYFLLIPFAATITEALSTKGLDNITIPISVMTLLNFYTRI